MMFLSPHNCESLPNRCPESIGCSKRDPVFTLTRLSTKICILERTAQNTMKATVYLRQPLKNNLVSNILSHRSCVKALCTSASRPWWPRQSLTTVRLFHNEWSRLSNVSYRSIQVLCARRSDLGKSEAVKFVRSAGTCIFRVILVLRFCFCATSRWGCLVW